MSVPFLRPGAFVVRGVSTYRKEIVYIKEIGAHEEHDTWELLPILSS
jgi:hypothetical protein